MNLDECTRKVKYNGESRENITYRLFENQKKLGYAVKKHIIKEFKINLAKSWS